MSPTAGELCVLCMQASTCAMSRRASTPRLCAVLPIQARTLSPGSLWLEQRPSLQKAFTPPAGARLQLCHEQLLLSDTDDSGNKWPLEGCPVAKVLRPFKKKNPVAFLSSRFPNARMGTWIVPSIAGDR